MLNNVTSIHSNTASLAASRLNFAVLDSIILSKFNNITSFAFHHGFSVEQTKACFSEMVDMLFDHQKIDAKGNLFFPHNLYKQFIFMMGEQGGLEHILKHFVEFGKLYKDACLNGRDYQNDNINVKINEAKYLLELHGYLVFNQLNFSPKIP